MSLYDYRASSELSRLDFPFYAMLFALIRRADTRNMALIEAAWPESYAEFVARYNAPGGVLDGD